MTKAPKKKKSPRTRTKTADVEIEAKRAKAYLDMEPHLCDVVRMGEIASMLFDDPDQGRFIFAVTHLDDMLQAFRARYYAEEFPPLAEHLTNEGAGSGPRSRAPDAATDS